MASQRLLGRLLRLRELEEELSRVTLERAAWGMGRLERELEATAREQAEGRHGFLRGVRENNAAERAGGVLVMCVAGGLRGRIEVKLAEAELELARQREEYLLRRSTRLQAETLLDEAHAEAEAELGRRAQQMQDDWYGRRRQAAVRDAMDDGANSQG